MGTEIPLGLTHTPGKASLLPSQSHRPGLCTHQSLGSDCVCCSQCPGLCRNPGNCSDEGITRCYAKLMDSSQKDDINTKSAIFSCQHVRNMAFLYATPATWNNSLLTIAAIPGILQNRKCCFIYNKLLGVIQQSMPTRRSGALCTAPSEPALPEGLLRVKVSTVFCLIKVSKCLPRSHTASGCVAIPFPTFASFPLIHL